MENFNWIGLVTALGGFGAAALFIREIVNILSLLRKGVAAKENKRSNDIIAQRDAALQRAAIAEHRADREIENRRILVGYASRLERQLILVGGEPQPWPEIDESTENPRA